MKRNIVALVLIFLISQILFGMHGADIHTEIIIQNQVRQTLDHPFLDFLIPNGLGMNFDQKAWTGTVYYGFNSYFPQNPSLDFGVYRNRGSFPERIGFLISVNRITGIEHAFQDHIRDLHSPDALGRTYYYVMNEIALAGREYAFMNRISLQGSLNAGIVYELTGSANINYYARTPLKLLVNLGAFRPGIHWEYIVHDSMEGWDVDNIRLVLEYTM